MSLNLVLVALLYSRYTELAENGLLLLALEVEDEGKMVNAAWG